MQETVRPLWECPCGFTTRDAEQRCTHNDTLGSEHFAFPMPHPTLRVDCSNNGCEQTGCPLSDCVWEVVTYGTCPECNAPARVYTERT